MAMLQLPDILQPPAWLSPVIPKSRGLDLLGLRAPAQAIGNNLMNGITTITPAVRYLSLRAWMLRTYALARAPDEWQAIRSWAANAEACIALGNRLAETHAPGVVGSDVASQLLEDPGEYIELKPLVMQIALQIYANPSSELGISFDRPSGVPGLSEERGLRLAEAVDDHFNSNKLADLVRQGQPLDKANLNNLREFGELAALNQIPDSERKVLIDSVMPEEPTTRERNRLATYSLLLLLTDKNNGTSSETDLFSAATSANEPYPPALDSIRDGWLSYLMRDMIAVCHESALACVVTALEGMQTGSATSVQRALVIESAMQRAIQDADLLKRAGLHDQPDRLSEMSFRNVFEALQQMHRIESSSDLRLARWLDKLSEKNIAELADSAGAGGCILLPLAWALVYYRTYSDEVSEDELPPELSRQGWARIGLAEVIKPSVEKFLEEDWSYLEVLQELLQRSVDQHLRIAWTRLRFEREPKDVAVISSDGRRWCYRKPFNPGRTASRVDQAISWLQQLKLIAPNGLTPEGKQILERNIGALEHVQ